MLIDFKSMLNKLITPRTGATVVKLTTVSNVGLYVSSRDVESKAIKLHDNSYVFHIQPGDVLLQGNYVRGSKIHTIEDLSELKPNYTIVQLDDGGNFYPLLDIPSNYRRRTVDDSLKNITKVLLSLKNGLDYDALKGIDCNPLCDIRPRVVNSPEAFKKAFVSQRGLGTIIDKETHKVAMSFNHHTGIVDIVVFTEQDQNIDLAPGISINVVNGYAKLMFDTEVFQFGPMVLEQITKPFKRDEEASANVTKDAESVKLD